MRSNKPEAELFQDALFAFKPDVGPRQRVRTVFVLGVVWFVATDVANVLGFRDAEVAARGLDDDEKQVHLIGVPGRGGRPYIIISEAGLYRLIFTSRRPEAEAFKRWLAHEVLPMIRRYGYYAPHRKPSRSWVRSISTCL